MHNARSVASGNERSVFMHGSRALGQLLWVEHN